MLICSKCKGANIQVLAWVDANTNEYKGEGSNETQDHWCDYCKENLRFETNTNIKHLRYDIMEAHLGCDEIRNATVVMKELGITYQHATPQSMGDQWWFWNCENIPDKLPNYLGEADLNPMTCIGYGLSKEEAEKIRDYDTG